MPRTKPIARATTGGRGLPWAFHMQKFRDHEGEECIRARYSSVDEPIPEDNRLKPIFCFQIYTTVPLDLDDAEQPVAKRVRPGSSEDRTVVTDLFSYLGLTGDLAIDDGRSCPVVDIYGTPQTDALACVEHQRREIAYRKARRDEKDTILIPKVTQGFLDSRECGFLIVVTSDSFTGGVEPLSTTQPDASAPLFVRFDRRFPMATSVEPQLRLECDGTLARSTGTLEEIAVWPEKMEVECERMQRISDMRRTQLSDMFCSAYKPYGDPPMSLALDQDEGKPNSATADKSLPDIDISTGQLSLQDFDVVRDGSVVTANNHESDKEPTLQYVVYVSFLDEGAVDVLEQVAKAFTSAVNARLSQGKTLALEFRIPPEPTLSSVWTSFNASQASSPDHIVGALTSSVAIPGRLKPVAGAAAAVDSQSPVKSTPSSPPLPARLHPVDRQPILWLNYPRTSVIEPFSTFLIILDRPDFVHGPGTLFMLADGGKWKQSPTDANGWFSGPTLNYVEMYVWRSAGFDDMVARLAMEFPSENVF